MEHRFDSRYHPYLTIIKIIACLLFLLTAFVTHSIAANDLPILFKEDFKRGSSTWKTTDPNAWQVRELDGTSNRVLELFGKSKYEPLLRSPFNLAVMKYHTVGNFVLTTRVQTKEE
tara:strand:- start:2568 stop:2915 length:348 start_codon:yes stop_codon:yes gene_type:complete